MAATVERLIELWYPPPEGTSGGGPQGAWRRNDSDSGAARPSWAGRLALALLQPFAALYGRIVCLRRSAYARGWLRAHTAGRPVIVIGNVTVGGTGKTPLILWLAAALRARGLSVGIVSRGYGRTTSGLRRVHSGSRAADVGDEPLLIHRRTGCPVLVAEDRVTAARRLAAEGIEVILSDDGLQHLRLARDCEIIVIDGERGFGNGRLIPAGPLREPTSRVLAADFVVVSGENASDRLGSARERRATMRLLAGETRRVDGEGSPRPLDSFRGSPVHAVAGIGHPARFFRVLQAHGLRVIEHAFADHHPFVRGELDYADDLPILMTEKDAVRCAALATPRMWYVPVETQLDASGGEALIETVIGRIGSRGAASAHTR